MKQGQLYEHIFATYISLRKGMAATGLLLPWIVLFWGYLFGIGLQPSISDYYWAAPGTPIVDFQWSIFLDQAAPSRVWFVGLIFALAAFLYLYKGFSVKENIALNLAALLAVGVAIFPMCKPGATCGSFSLHGLSAVLAFACLAYVVWFCARDTLPYLPKDAKPNAAHYKKIYAVLGLFMLGAPVAAFLVNAIVGTTSYVFWVEVAGISAFGFFWWFKALELNQSKEIRRRMARAKTTPSSADLATPFEDEELASER